MRFIQNLWLKWHHFQYDFVGRPGPATISPSQRWELHCCKDNCFSLFKPLLLPTAKPIRMGLDSTLNASLANRYLRTLYVTHCGRIPAHQGQCRAGVEGREQTSKQVITADCGGCCNGRNIACCGHMGGHWTRLFEEFGKASWEKGYD